MNLSTGDLVDVLMNRVWWPSTVVESAVENGTQRVRITFRRFSENGAKVDSEGNRYDGLGPNEDNWYDVLSCTIQKPGMAKELCLYSHTA